MSAPLFTPGPWWVDEDDRPGMQWNRHICAGYSNRICFLSNSGNDPSGEANANLIASAPELYDALMELSGAASDHLTGFAGPEYLADAVRSADAALAKARGEANSGQDIAPLSEEGVS